MTQQHDTTSTLEFRYGLYEALEKSSRLVEWYDDPYDALVAHGGNEDFYIVVHTRADEYVCIFNCFHGGGWGAIRFLPDCPKSTRTQMNSILEAVLEKWNASAV